MKVNLTLSERINLLEILPGEGNFVTLKVIRELKLYIGVKDEEFKKYNIKQEGNQISWNKEGNKEIEFDFGEKAMDIIIEELEKLDKSSKLAERQFSLFEKFVKQSNTK